MEKKKKKEEKRKRKWKRISRTQTHTNSNEFDSPAQDLALVQKTKRVTNTHECLFKPIEGKSTQIPNDRKIMHNKIIKTDIVVAQITIQHES